MPPIATPLASRFDRHYIPEPNSGCWLWLLATVKTRDKTEYGVVSNTFAGRKQMLAHRASYEIYKGVIPEGAEIDHICGNKLCVNPEHLEALSQSEHQKRTHARKYGADRCRRGHAFTPENTWMEKTGARHCRHCHKLMQRGYISRSKAKKG